MTDNTDQFTTVHKSRGSEVHQLLGKLLIEMFDIFNRSLH